MNRPSIEINRVSGGLGRPLAGSDHISGFISYQDTLPTGFGTNKLKEFFSIEEVEAAGIIAGSIYDVEHYHLSEYFRMQPKGDIFVYLEDIPADPLVRTYDEIVTLQSLANGAIRQLGVYVTVEADSSDFGKIQAHVDTLRSLAQPLQVLIGYDSADVTDWSLASDLSALDNEGVSAVLAQSGSGEGASLFATKGYSITSVGNALGCVSLASVHENIGWLEKFPLSNGSEMAVGALSNGDEITELSAGLLNSLHAKHYMIPENYPNDVQTYYTDSLTSTSPAGDFSTIENNRTIDKASRQIRTFVQPKLKSPIYVTEKGTLDEATTAMFEDLTEQPLQDMLSAGELSAYQVLIDPTQDILSTSTLVITVNLIPVGVGRTIVFNIGFQTSITQA